jgi:hypothetical protein
MKKMIVPVIISLLLIFAFSNLAVFVSQMDFWQQRYGMYSTGLQIEMMFWVLMFVAVIIGVIYLWWKKAI